MTIRKILTEPDPFLRQKSAKVDQVNDGIRTLMDDMLETMYDAPGIGLAAIQVGVPIRVIVIDLSKDDEKKNPLYFINPEIIMNSDKDVVYEEGCLSVPGQFAEINRPDKCKVKHLDYYGDEKILDAQGLLATCIQHEIDHLEGILFIDYLSKLKKSMIIKKLSKQKKTLERIIV
jgi:peptide deformylase